MNQRQSPVIEQWAQWLQSCTDRLLALDERAKANASADDQRLLAATFVARKAVAERLGAVTSALTTRKPDDPRVVERVEELFSEPVRDDLGQVLGPNVAAVAELIDTTLSDVDRRLQAIEAEALSEAQASAAASADLAVAGPLATELGSEVNAVASLTGRLDRRERLADVAAQAAALRQRLQAMAAERDRAASQLALGEHRLTTLTATEQRIRALAARCQDKIADPPRLAIPSVERLGTAPVMNGGVPWTAQRSTVSTYLERLDRLDQAFAEAERRFQAPLTRRDEMRGLLQAFRDKAAANGGAEDETVAPLYKAAADILWSAPCDLERAQAAVQRYIDAVNSRRGQQ